MSVLETFWVNAFKAAKTRKEPYVGHCQPSDVMLVTRAAKRAGFPHVKFRYDYSAKRTMVESCTGPSLNSVERVHAGK